MALLDRDGVKIYYEVYGEGPPLLLTHGFASSSHMWAGQREAFGNQFRLITWDMRGHGRSDYPADEAAYSQAATVSDMAAILDHVGAKTAILGGHSLGGYMSLAFRLAHPERVRGLLIISTGPGFNTDEAREGWNTHALRTADFFEREGLARLSESSVEARTAPHRDASGVAHAARGMLTQHDASVINSLPEITVPALVIVGANDKPLLATSDYVASKIPGAKKVVIAGSGHAANIDQPEAFNKAVLEFLADAGLTE
ncbi:MAG TPA: alpha/beta fold hydrolase [Rhizomicrobium sp.]|nr:alpha/beta fold hydrolase [Rhizomicrobium sp.]